MDKVWYNGRMIYDELFLGQRNKSVFIDRFKNRILEPIAADLFDYYEKELLSSFQIWSVNRVKSKVIKKLENCYGLAIMLKDLNKGQINWTGVSIHNSGIAGELYSKVESLLFEELEEPWAVMMDLRGNRTKPRQKEIWDEWAKSLAWLPQRDTVQRDEEDNIPDEEMEQIVGLIESCLEDSRSFVGASDNQVADEIIKKAAELGIKMNNASYRELYECLVFFDLISKEQVEYHKKTGSKYVRENYIKMKAKRIGLLRNE